MYLTHRSTWTLDSKYKAVIEQMRDENIINHAQFDKIMGSTDMKDLVDVLKSIPGYDRKKSKGFALVRCWTGFLDRLSRFEKALNTLSQADKTGCFLWGLLKVVVQVCSTAASIVTTKRLSNISRT